VFVISGSASTCTTARGYTPASLCERVASVVGQPQFRMAFYPVQVTWCLATAPLARQVPALTRPVVAHACRPIEPEEQEGPRTDPTLARALRMPSINTTARHVGPLATPI
jgi:hypothetical protein